MASSNIFKRKEYKYIITNNQYSDLKNYMKEFMQLDEHKRHRISNIYFDTSDYKIIRRSIEKPIYKEKLRLRKYDHSTSVFIELKKKYDGTVYKRRIEIDEKKLNNDIKKLEKNTQINKEIHGFLDRYDEIDARVYLAYDREAYFGKLDQDFRMTFDFNVVARNEEISLEENKKIDWKITKENQILLEVKTLIGLPKWLLIFFKENKIYKQSFSKYGATYKEYIYPKLLKEE